MVPTKYIQGTGKSSCHYIIILLIMISEHSTKVCNKQGVANFRLSKGDACELA